MLAEEDPFDLAMVDMLFRGCPMSGLGAMRILRDSSPGTKVIVRSADEENRLLHLLAAFSFFEPLAFESKSEGPERIRDLVLAAQECKAVTSSASLYRLEGGLPDPVNRLIRNKTDLTLWQMLARFDKRDDIARASFVSSRTVDNFIGDKHPVVDELMDSFGDAAVRIHVGHELDRHTPLIRLTSFARTHPSFFRDPTLEDLLGERWAARRKKLSDSSAGLRQVRPKSSPWSRKSV